MGEVDLLKYLKKPNRSCQVSVYNEKIIIRFTPYCVSPYLDLRGIGKPVKITVCSESEDATVILSGSPDEKGEFVNVHPCKTVTVPMDKAVVWFSGEFGTSMSVDRWGEVGGETTQSPEPSPQPEPHSNEPSTQQPPTKPAEVPELSTGTLVIAGLIGLVAGIAVARWVR